AVQVGAEGVARDLEGRPHVPAGRPKVEDLPGAVRAVPRALSVAEKLAAQDLERSTMARKNAEAMFRILQDEWAEKGIDLDDVAKKCMALRIETPSWAYANCGTRFGVVKDPAAPRDAYEKVADAAQVHKVTGITPAVAVHVLWDSVPDWTELQRHAFGQGIRIGAINPNLFTEPQYTFGSICSADPKVRRAAVDNMNECVDIGRAVGSKVLSLWFADGTNYPGQGDFRRRKGWME